MGEKEKEKSLGYSRDDVFIISVNNSADKIEIIEAELFLNPNNIFFYYGKINALYSKTHSYIKINRKINERLLNIRNALYNKDFLHDLKNDKIKPETNKHFVKIVDNLTQIYREMTEDYTIGIFPKIEIEDIRPGVTKQR